MTVVMQTLPTLEDVKAHLKELATKSPDDRVDGYHKVVRQLSDLDLLSQTTRIRIESELCYLTRYRLALGTYPPVVVDSVAHMLEGVIDLQSRPVA